MASCDVNIVVASAEVELGVDLCAAKLVEEVGDKWDQIPILPCDLVEVSELTQSCRVPSFFLEKRTGAPAGNWDDQMNLLPSMSSVTMLFSALHYSTWS